MSIKPIDFEAEGYGNSLIQCSIVKAATPSDHLALVFPGYRHSVDRSDLWYPAQMLLERGVDVVRVLSLYADTDITSRSPDEQAQWIASDAQSLLEAALCQGDYSRLVCVGRSLGTLSMAYLLDHVQPLSPVFIWLSPLLDMPKLEESVTSHKPASLFVVGGKDQNFEPSKLERLRGSTEGRVFVIENAHHGLEVSGNVEMTLWALGKLIEGVKEFLDEYVEL
jgi:hypothetical protein